MPRIATLLKQTDWKVLTSNSSANYTQVWEEVFNKGERVAYVLIGHASVNVTFNVQIASDAAGTGAASVTTDVAFTDAGEVYVLDITPGVLTDTKSFVSALVTRSAGTYTLLRVQYDLRTTDFTLDATVAYRQVIT